MPRLPKVIILIVVKIDEGVARPPECPKVPWGGPRVAQGNPKVAKGSPKVAPGWPRAAPG